MEQISQDFQDTLHAPWFMLLLILRLRAGVLSWVEQTSTTSMYDESEWRVPTCLRLQHLIK